MILSDKHIKSLALFLAVMRDTSSKSHVLNNQTFYPYVKWNTRFSSTYTNSDGSSCTLCILCPGSRLNSLFDLNVKSTCVDCFKATDSCSQMKVISTFDKEWKINFFLQSPQRQMPPCKSMPLINLQLVTNQFL